MFSLVITLISIALVAALAIATLYYMGGAQNKAFLATEATEQINQGTQILGAMDLFRLDNDRWPDSLDELVDQGYLKAIPRIGINASKATIVPQANAQSLGPAWEMPLPGVPIAWVSPPAGGYTTSVCKEINLKARRYEGILKSMQITPDPQCFGKNLNRLRVVVARAAADIQDLATNYEEDVDSRSYPPIWDITDNSWLIAPPDTRTGSEGDLTQPDSTVSGARLEIDQLSFNFGTLLRGQASPLTGVFELSNTGSVAITGLSFTLTNQEDGYTYTTNCTPTLNPSQTCTINANFAALKDRSTFANIFIDSNQTSRATLLLQSAVAAPVLSWSNSFNFGTLNVGATSFQSSTLTNEGNYPAENLSITLANPTNTTVAIANNSCPATLAAGQSCEVQLSHTPAVAGTRTAPAVVATATGAVDKPANYSSTSIGFELQWSGASFGDVPVNTSINRTFTLTAEGTGSASGVYVELQAPSSVVLVSNNCGTVTTPVNLAANGTCSVTLSYTPVSTGSLNSAKLTAFSSVSSKEYTLVGNGVMSATQGILEQVGGLSGVQFTSSSNMPGPSVNVATNVWRNPSNGQLLQLSAGGLVATKSLGASDTQTPFIVDFDRAIRFKNTTTIAVYGFNNSTMTWDLYPGSEQTFAFTRKSVTLRGQYNPLDGFYYVINPSTSNGIIGVFKFRLVNSTMVDYSSYELNLSTAFSSYGLSAASTTLSRSYFGPDGWLYIMGNNSGTTAQVQNLLAINMTTGQSRLVPFAVPSGYSITQCVFSTQCRLDFVFDSGWNILRQLNGQILLYPYQGGTSWGAPYPVLGTFRSTDDSNTSSLTSIAGTGSAARVGAGFTLSKGPSDSVFLIGRQQLWRIR